MGNPLEGMFGLVAEGKVIIVTLPNGTSMIVAPDVLEKHYHIFKNEDSIKVTRTDDEMPDIE